MEAARWEAKLGYRSGCWRGRRGVGVLGGGMGHGREGPASGPSPPLCRWESGAEVAAVAVAEEVEDEPRGVGEERVVHRPRGRRPPLPPPPRLHRGDGEGGAHGGTWLWLTLHRRVKGGFILWIGAVKGAVVQ